MLVGETVTGQQRGWSLLQKLGEGDAGEVYLVESPLDKSLAILKRPHRSAFSSDIIRQASQIETEGKILRALAGVSINGAAGQASARPSAVRLAAPSLLDGSLPGQSFGERCFIVIEKAPGLDLAFLARAARFGLPEAELSRLSGPLHLFIQHLIDLGEIPDLILLRALSVSLEFLEKIHALRATVDGQERSGVLWNDVKPEHIFWDPVGKRSTLIDWGNSQFLEADGATRDRRSSRGDDWAQFVDEMGKFVALSNPDLHARLMWPSGAPVSEEAQEAVDALKEKIAALLQGELDGLLELRGQEADLVGSDEPRLDGLERLDDLHHRLLDYGEFPDWSGAEHFCVKLGTRLVSNRRLADLRQVSGLAGRLPGSADEKWQLLTRLAELAPVEAASQAQIPAPLLNALLAGLNDDWPETLWGLLLLTPGASQEPPWWEPLCSSIRRIQLGATADGLTPFVIACRLGHTLQAAYLKLGDTSDRDGSAGPDSSEADLPAFGSLIKTLREEVLPKWQQVEPDPPDAGLEYADIGRLAEAIAARLPEAWQALAAALDQPRAQVRIVLEAWGRKDVETARRGLRLALLWDPDRRRVLTAEDALLRTPAWLETVYLGPRRGESIQDFLAHIELEGRELRNQVGSARWLDLILDALTRLRKGANPADLIFEHPELLTEMSWLNEYEQHRPAPVARNGPVKLERAALAPASEPILRGVREGALGPREELALGDPLDTWAPEARGSSARVFLGKLRRTDGTELPAAVKIMRPGRGDYALPLFREEVQILTLIRDVPGVNRMLECGFILPAFGHALPEDDRPSSAAGMDGTVVRFGPAEIREFLSNLEARAGQGWLPYLACEQQARQNNLVMLCDAGYTHGRFLPIQEGLRLAIQILDVLQAAHLRNIVYRDHKILHYYWLEENNGVSVIDWNVAKRQPQGLSSAERGFDLVQFGARALHHILTGRVAPGALPLGPTRPEEIEQAATTYSVQWTYDDQRLPTVLRDEVERVLAGGYNSAKELRDDLLQIFLQLPDTIL